MLKNITLKITSIVLLLPLQVFAAENNDPMKGLNTAAGIGGGSKTALLKGSPEDIVASVINGVLTLLGSIFLALIVYGGFKWLTSRGNAEAVGEAKKILASSVIGLIIVVAAYSITYAVITLVYGDAAGGAGVGEGGAN